MIEVYDSFLDVPLDDVDPEEDGDDSVLAGLREYDAPLVAPRLSSPPPSRLVAPFPGKLKRGDRSKAVVAINRALRVAGFRRVPGRFSRLYTRWVARALRRFQAANGLPATGVYDLATHRALARYFDEYAIKHLLLAPIPKPTVDERERAAFVAQLMYIYNRRWSIAYTQARPFDLRRPPRGLDCSASGEWAAKWAGFGRTLSGWSSFGAGNTWSQLAFFRSRNWIRPSIRDAKPGDPKYYGRSGSPTHVAYYVGHVDGRARVWSFGSFPAKIIDADYRHDGIAVCNLTGR